MSVIDAHDRGSAPAFNIDDHPARAALRSASSTGRIRPLIGSIKRLGTALAVAEFAIVLAASFLAKAIYVDVFYGPEQPFFPYLALAIGLGVTVSLVFDQMGLYGETTLASRVIGFGKVWGGLATSILILLGVLYLLKISDDFSRGWMLLWFVITALAIVVVRARSLAWVEKKREAGALRDRVALIGTSSLVADVQQELRRTCPHSFISGTYVIARDRADCDALSSLSAALAASEFDRVVICLPLEMTNDIRATVKRLGRYSAELLLCSDTNEYPVHAIGSRCVGQTRMDIINTVPLATRSMVVKSTVDYLVAALAVVALAPLFLVVAAAIKLDSAGPVFFRQRRYGFNNRVFRIYKFRTMHVEEDGAVVRQAEKRDARVTRVGWLLRRTSLDELPQLLNVLVGDMSLVGPRPHAIAHDDDFETHLDSFSLRRRVRPGLTGWAQVNGFRGETRTTEDVRQRMQYDLYYIDNWSIWFDLEILVRTLVVFSKGAY
ncbi:MAG: undecaprenyl-phosphate glucose phosphotransferase [Hyphomicrobium sp.]